MRTKIYWALGVLILLIICTAGGLFIRHNLFQLSQFERDAADADKLLQDHNRSVGEPAEFVLGAPSTTDHPRWVKRMIRGIGKATRGIKNLPSNRRKEGSGQRIQINSHTR